MFGYSKPAGIHPESYRIRQPVFDQAMTVWAYEVPQGSEIGHIGKKVMVHVPDTVINDQLQRIYPAETTIVQLTPDNRPDDRLMASIDFLKVLGYSFSCLTHGSLQETFCSLADYISIDFKGETREALESLVKQCRQRYPQSALIARHIDTYEDYVFAKGLDVDYFQGFFYKKPAIGREKELLPLEASKLNILGLLQEENVDFSKISKALSMDGSIVRRLLANLTSSLFCSGNPIHSLDDALDLLGPGPLKKWLHLIVFSDLKPREKPQELVLLAAHRACFLELVARYNRYETIKDTLFKLGLFSLIHALLDRPREDLIPRLPLERNLQKALLGKRSPYAPWLKLVDGMETPDWNALSTPLKKLKIHPDHMVSHHEEACRIAETFFRRDKHYSG